MKQGERCLQACKVANIEFLFQRKSAAHKNSQKILFHKKSTDINSTPNIARHVQSFIPKTFVHAKRQLLNHISQRARNKPLQTFQTDYKRFPIRKARTASAHPLTRRYSNFNLGVDDPSHTFFKNPRITNSLCAYRTESRESKPHSPYAPRRKSLFSLFSKTLSSV